MRAGGVAPAPSVAPSVAPTIAPTIALELYHRRGGPRGDLACRRQRTSLRSGVARLVRVGVGFGFGLGFGLGCGCGFGCGLES